MTTEAPKQRSRLRRAFRVVRRMIYVLFAILAVAVIAGLIVIHTSWGRNEIREMVEAELRGTFTGGAKIGSLEGSLLSDFTLRDIEIDSLDGKPAFKIGRLTTNVALTKLFNKTAELEYLELEDVQVAVGGAPLKKPAEQTTEPSEPSTWSVSLQQISLTKGNFVALGEQPQHIDGLDLEGGVEIPAGRRITAHVLATARWRERDAPILIDASTAVGDTTIIRRGTINVGKVQFEATRVAIDPTRPTGKVEISGTAAAIAELLPQVQLPADAKLVLEAKPAGAVLQVTVDGSVGDARIAGSLRGDIATRTMSGYIGVGALEIGPFLPPSANAPPHMRGEVALAVSANKAGAHGIVGVHGATLDLPSSDATILLDTDWKQASVTVLATGEGDAKLAATAHGTRAAKTIAVDRARVIASASSLAAVTADRVKLTGGVIVDARLAKPGTLAPALDLELAGSARGTRIAYDDVRVASLVGSFNGNLRDKITGHAHADVRGASKAGSPLGYAVADADYLEDGRIKTRIDAHPAMAAVGIVANAMIAPGEITRITLGDHVITPAVGAPWIGKGGTITIADSISVKDFTTTNGAGRAKVDAQVVGTMLDAKVDATQVPVSAIDPKLKGTISGTLGIKRRSGRWDGGGDVTLAGLVVAPEQPSPLDGTAKLTLAGRTIKLDTHTKAEGIGAVRFELDVEGPRDITDVAGWKRLDRSALHDATLTIDNIELAKVSRTGGLVTGKISLGPARTEGSIDIKNIETPVGIAEGTMTFSPQGNGILASWKALLSEVGEGTIAARIDLPQHPFDPAAYQQLGRGVLQGMSATFADLAIDPAKLEKLGVKAPYTGRADIQVDVGPSAAAATVAVDLRSVEGGVIVKPIDLHVSATTDGTGTTASACGALAKDPRGDACATRGLAATTTALKLFELTDASVPVSFPMWLADPKTALAAPLQAKISVPKQSAPAYLAIAGRTDFDPKKGDVQGDITIGGTVGRPTAAAGFELAHLQLVTELVGRDIPELSTAKLTGNWDGAAGWIQFDTRDSKGGTLHAKVSGKRDAWQDGKGELTAVELDLAPLAAFLPGELKSSQGLLRAKLTMTGFDLATSKLDGDLHINRAQVPIHPMAGTLKDATVNVVMSDAGMKLDAKGLLNSCRDPDRPKCTENVWLDATATTDLSRIDGTLYANKISTIGEIEPIIDGHVNINLVRHGGQLTGEIAMLNCTKADDPKRCRDGHIVVPVSTGDDLLDFDVPEDVYFIENAPTQNRLGEARVPTKAWLDVLVSIDSTRLDIDQFGVKGSIVTHKPLHLQIGDAIGLEGKVSVEYGSADNIFGRQYTIDPNDLVSFDGTIDPTIDLVISHAFPEFTMTARIAGRLSDPDFPPKPKFSSDSGNYSEDDMFGFFIGGDPAGPASAGAQSAARGAGASLLSQFLSAKFKEVLPGRLKLGVIGKVLDPNVLKCEPGATTGGSSCTIGYRFYRDRVFVSLKHRITPLPNENGEELDLQYNLSREWFLEGTGGNANIIGADLLWHRRW